MFKGHTFSFSSFWYHPGNFPPSWISFVSYSQLFTLKSLNPHSPHSRSIVLGPYPGCTMWMKKNVPSGKKQTKHRPHLMKLPSFIGRMDSVSRVSGLDHSQCQVPENTMFHKWFHSRLVITIWAWAGPIQVSPLLLGIRVSFHSMSLYFLHNKTTIRCGSHCVPGAGNKVKRVQLISSSFPSLLVAQRMASSCQSSHKSTALEIIEILFRAANKTPCNLKFSVLKNKTIMWLAYVLACRLGAYLGHLQAVLSLSF